MTRWDPHQRLLTPREAAESIHRPYGTVRRWIHEERLRPHARRGKRLLFLEADVLRVDAETRRCRR